MIHRLCVRLNNHSHRCSRVRSSGTSIQAVVAWQDEYSYLNDRIDAPPPPFPCLRSKRSIRFKIVRHGQSTWNAANRIQGSSDLSELTKKGQAQAQLSREMLSDTEFDLMFASPLKRARETADIIVAGRSIPRHDLIVLREIDLYSFQGLNKQEVKDKFPSQHKDWKDRPELFEIDGHAPCREMWHRGGLAWQQVVKLIEDANERDTRDLTVLVVAHNNMNQALIASALGLDSTYFRRLVQSNAAMSSLLVNKSGSEQTVKLEFLNQSPFNESSVLFQRSPDEKVTRVFVWAATSDSDHIRKINILLDGANEDVIDHFFVDQNCDEALHMVQQLMGPTLPREITIHPPSYLTISCLKETSSLAPLTVIITSVSTASSIICQALDLEDTPKQRSPIEISPGGYSILEIEDGKKVTAHCINSTSHLKYRTKIEEKLYGNIP